jgi:hypothetical protein
MLRRTIVSKRTEVTGEWRRLNNEESKSKKEYSYTNTPLWTFKPVLA